MKKFVIFIFTLIICLSGVLSSCTQKDAESTATPSPTATLTAPPTPTPLPERLSGYLDNIFFYETSPENAAQQVLDGTLDIFGSGLSAQQIAALQDSSVGYAKSISKQYEILLNPADTKKTAGTINPFASSAVREALNYLIDRQYITEKIFSGGAEESYVPLPYGLTDYTRYEETINQIKEKYAYNYDTANEIITNYMLANGCLLNDDGKWTYKDEAVNIIILIRNDDVMREEIGDYISRQLESVGLSVTKQYTNQNQSNAIWAATDPAEGLWHLYTGRWSYDEQTADKNGIFELLYTNQSNYNNVELYRQYSTGDEFFQAAETLAKRRYETVEQRDALFISLLNSCNEYSFRIWLADEYSYSPYSPKIEITSSLSNGIDSDIKTPFTLNKLNVWGGEINWGTNSLLKGSVNPVGGSSSYSEKQFLNFTQLPAAAYDIDEGEILPLLINSADIIFDSSLNFIQDSTWITASSADEIAVPNDAVIGWDSLTGTAIYADADYMHDAVGLATAWLATYEREKNRDKAKISAQQQIIEDLHEIELRGYITADVKVTVTYDDCVADLVWQDGSPFTVADIIMCVITKSQLVDKSSPLYDPYIAEIYAEELANFRGFKILSESPLVIEYYTDSDSLYVSENLNPLWVDYFNGQQSWAMTAVSNALCAQRTANYTAGASLDNLSAYLNYLKGDSLSLINLKAEEYTASSYIPYQELLGAYLTEDTVSDYYQNILDFYTAYGHFCIGLGPYFISDFDLLTPTLTLSRYDGLCLPSDIMKIKLTIQ